MTCTGLFLTVRLPLKFGSRATIHVRMVKFNNKLYTEAYTQFFRHNRESFQGEAEDITGIKEQIDAFVKRYVLNDGAVLDIGSGGGSLQDAAQNYTGLDISPTAARFYHKKFVVGS